MFFRNCTRTVLTVITPFLLLLACDTPNLAIEQAGETEMDSLVTAQWLNDHLNDEDLVVLDCTVQVVPDEKEGFRIVNGRENYDKGHIPTAGFADLMGELSDKESPYQFTVPSPEQFAATMGALGIGDSSRVVLYDNSNSAWAARVWWMLRWLGFDRAALLDGGQKAWVAEGLPLSTAPSSHVAKVLTPDVRPELIVDRDEVRAAIDNPSINLIDALNEEQYSGAMTMYARPGHISTATNVPSSSLMDDNGHFRPKDELEAKFNLDRGQRAITYCGGGIAASADAFVMSRLGYSDVAVYTDSLQEWTLDPANPMETSSSQSD